MRLFAIVLLSFVFLLGVVGCSTTGSKLKTVESVDINKFMGDWYVLAGRFTFLEKDVHNGFERYTWNKEEERIDVDFTFHKGAITGPKKSLPQKAWIYNQETKAHWKVSPLWPFKFDYLIVALDNDYRWTAIGVPDQKYLWIMARDWKNPGPVIEKVVRELEKRGYDAKNLVEVPQLWP
jgi:apolipoprotein D and lipocalin family protein